MVANTSATQSSTPFWQIQNWRIGPKLTFFFTLLAVVPVIVVGLFQATAARNALLAEGDARLTSASATTAQRIDDALVEGRQFAAVLSQLPEFARFLKTPTDSATRASAQSALKAALLKSVDYDSVAIAGQEGKFILSSSDADIGTDIHFRVWFTTAMQGNLYIDDPLVAVLNNQPVEVISAPIKDENGATLGVLRNRLRLDAIGDFVASDNAAHGTGSFSMLVDENGIRLYDSRIKSDPTVLTKLLYRAIAPLPKDVEQQILADKRFSTTSTTNVPVLPLPEVAVAVQSGKSQTFESDVDLASGRYRASMTVLKTKPWRYIVFAPVSTYTETADRTLLLVVVVSVIAVIAAVLVGTLFARTITVPLTQLSNVADRISLGELDAKIEVRSKDEIGDLAEAVSRMQASLQAAIERLRARRTVK
jgi:C4-dicarboxylate-specific signal transduction histidine kinase